MTSALLRQWPFQAPDFRTDGGTCTKGGGGGGGRKTCTERERELPTEGDPARLFPDASLVRASSRESRSATQVAPLEISDS